MGGTEYVQVGFDCIWKNTLDFDADGEFSCKEIGKAVTDNHAETAAAFASTDENCCPLMRIAKGIDPDGKSNGDLCGWYKECKSGCCDKRSSSSSISGRRFRLPFRKL
jgi:hypothetical protein